MRASETGHQEPEQKRYSSQAKDSNEWIWPLYEREKNVKLYSWQKNCLTRWREHQYRGIIRVVTGAGKTVFALAAIDELRDKYPDVKIRIVVPTIPLANQWKMALIHHAPDERWRPGFFGGGTRDEPDRQVMIYVINSARGSLASHMCRDLALKRHVLLICDECHHYQSRENSKIFGFLNEEVLKGPLYHSLGMSATPFGTNHDELLVRFLGEEIFRYDFNTAAEDGVISSFHVCEISASFMPKELLRYVELTKRIGVLFKKLLSSYPRLKTLNQKQFIKAVAAIARQNDMDPEEPAAAFLMLTYQRRNMTNLAEARIRCAVSLISQLHETDRILVFCERISQAEELCVILRQRYGHACGIYHSGMTAEARKRILNEFRSGRMRILVSCRCLDEGIDVPDANIGIVLSSSSVERQRVQRLGRVIRRADNKSAACLYYIYIRESSDDAAYLHGLEYSGRFTVRYYSAENAFSNDLYEYIAAGMLGNAHDRGYNQEQLTELRSCLMEGLVRADCFLQPDALEMAAEYADDRHKRNYWSVMLRVGDAFREKE